MIEQAADFRRRLIRRTGLSDSAITAAWPDWWSEAADASPAAQAELRFSLARKLGLDPRSLLDEQEPRFVWNDSARFKGFSGDAGTERPVLASFGTALSRMLLQATPVVDLRGVTPSAGELRKMMLGARSNIGLVELMMAAWGLGIPVIHLRVYPLAAKRMSAMSVRVGDRFAILMARDAMYPAPLAFHLAHELGHIFLNHLAEGDAIIDLASLEELNGDDPEEMAADAFALELLTGRSSLAFQIEGEGRGARQLASESQRIGTEQRIEPGTVALAFGYATKRWDTANAALRNIYTQPYDAWRAINQVAVRHLQWDALPDESESFVRAVMGAIDG